VKGNETGRGALMSSVRSKIIGWGAAVLLGFLAGLGTGRWLWKTTNLTDSFTDAQAQVDAAFSRGVEAAQLFTLGVAGSVALIVFLGAAIVLRSIQSGRGRRKGD